MAQRVSSSTASPSSESGVIWVTTRTGIGKSAGNAPKTILSAETPPVETPITTALNALSLLFCITLPIDLRPWFDFFILVGDPAMVQALLCAEAEKTTRPQTAVK